MYRSYRLGEVVKIDAVELEQVVASESANCRHCTLPSPPKATCKASTSFWLYQYCLPVIGFIAVQDVRSCCNVNMLPMFYLVIIANKWWLSTGQSACSAQKLLTFATNVGVVEIYHFRVCKLPSHQCVFYVIIVWPILRYFTQVQTSSSAQAGLQLSFWDR